MQLPRLIARRVLGLGAVAFAATLAACSDASTLPTDATIARKKSGYLTTSAAIKQMLDINFSVLYPGLGIQNAVLSTKADTTVETFTVDNAKGSIVAMGSSGNIIAMPAGSLCDPAKNTYGPTEWQKSCVLATAPINFTVKSWLDAAGHPHSDFQPSLRFSPDPTKNVRLYFQDRALSNYSVVYIPYCNAAGLCVNEEIGDPALTTYVSPITGGGYWVYRTLRHFSGYNVTAY
jgi:hypothetical protein